MYEYICYFIIYSFLGWCTEVAYAAIKEEKFVNRGFLNGPVCPIYGFGMIIIVLALTPLFENKYLLFLGAVVLTSTLEWITGFALEKIFHAKWWDYKNEPMNLSGYICVKFSILWGFACVIVIYFIHPFIVTFALIISNVVGYFAIGIILVLMAADTTMTVVAVNKLNRQLSALQEISEKLHILSDELGENIYEGVTSIKEKTVELKERAEELSEEIKESAEEIKIKTIEFKEKVEKIKEKAEEVVNQKSTSEFEELKENYRLEMQKSFFGQKRLIKAFPNLKPQNKYDIFNNLKKNL